MKKIILLHLAALLLVAVGSCKKNVPGNTAGITPPKCLIKSETNSLAGNEKNFDYQYDNKGLLTAVNVTTAQYNVPVGSYETTSGGVIYSYPSAFPGKINKNITI